MEDYGDYKNKAGGFDLEGYLKDYHKPLFSGHKKKPIQYVMGVDKAETVDINGEEWKFPTKIEIQILKNRCVDKYGVQVTVPPPYKGEIMEVF